MISPLGPRGAVGVSRPMATPSMQDLELLIQWHSSNGPVCSRTHSDGTRWIDASRKLGGRKVANKKRRPTQ